MVHAGLAAVTQIDVLAIDPDEAKAMAEAAANVQRHYPSSMLDPVTMDWIGLIVTCGTIYGPRIAVMKMQRAERAEQNPPTQTAPKPAAATPAQPATKIGGVDITQIVPPGFAPRKDN